MADAFPLAARGVFQQPYLVRGQAEYVAVDSRGEQIAVRWVRKDRDPASVIADLWDELNEFDPVPIHASGPFLRLVQESESAG